MNVHELAESRNWALIMDKLPGDNGGWDAVSGRVALTHELERFLDTLEATSKAHQWPGLPPSCRYRFATSRCGYLTRLCKLSGFVDLAHLVTLLVSPGLMFAGIAGGSGGKAFCS